MNRTAIAKAAWGLELAASAAVLVRVARGDDVEVRVDRREEFELSGFLASGALPAQLVSALSQIPSDEPVGVCFPDQSMLCRGFSLPRSKPAEMEKMVKAQAEALLPAGDDRLRWTWKDFPDPLNADMQWVLLCAARRELLDRLKSAIPSNAQLRILTPRVAATSNGCVANGAAPELLIDATDESATLGLRVNGQLLRCAVMERNGDEPAEWFRQARLTYRSLLDGIPRDRAPTAARPTTRDQAAAVADLPRALGLELVNAPAAEDAAVSAARLALDDASPSINFARAASSADEAATPARRGRRAIALAVFCIAGILIWYGIDAWRGAWLARRVDQLRSAEATSGGIDRRLGIDRYLEKNVPVALPGLDAILGAAPQSLSITSIGVSPAGQFRLVGQIQNPAELDPFLRSLQQSPTLTNVQLRSAHGDQQRWSIELSADAAPMAGLMLGPGVGSRVSGVGPEKHAASSPATRTAKPETRATQPATMPKVQPATRPGVAP